MELISTAWLGDHIYVGGQNDELSARVIGWTEVFPGQLLCQCFVRQQPETGRFLLDRPHHGLTVVWG